MAKGNNHGGEVELKIARFNFSEYTMFLPRGKNSLKKDYPEINKFSEFKDLNQNELLFCWFYGHEASPFYEIESPRQKSMLCYEYAFEKVPCKNAPKKENIMTGSIPESLKVGIKRMESFRIGIRVRAMKFMEKTMDHFDELINVDLNGPEFIGKDGEVDYTKKNQFITSLARANEVIPVLLNRLENGYSIENVKSMKEDSDDISFMDSYHENQE